MNGRIARIVRNIKTWKELAQFEANARRRNSLDGELDLAVKAQYTSLARKQIAQRTGCDLSQLSPAESKIVEAASEYLGLKKRRGSDAGRTVNQLRDRGLIGAAEASVSKSTQGFKELVEADRIDLSYERIILDHPTEFSPIAVWNSKKRLGLPAGPRPLPEKQTRANKQTESHLNGSTENLYWVFVCNPKKWAIDAFLDRRIEHDTWGIRPSDRHHFSPGQLGIVRVGVDQRSKDALNGKPRLQAGIYALCEVESEAFAGTGAGDEFWSMESARKPGWPTIKIRYLRVYRQNPLLIETIRQKLPSASPLLLNGFQAASFPIPAADFRAVLDLLGEDVEALPSPVEQGDTTADKLAELEQKYLNASPEVKERISKSVERGPVGVLLKRAIGFKCQLCAALGAPAIGFLKKSGEPYVEAHHAMPVSKGEIGSLAASNVMILCANHHRQMHYGSVNVVIEPTKFKIIIGGMSIDIPRPGVAPTQIPTT